MKAKLNGIYWCNEDEVKEVRKDLKKNGFKTKITGGDCSDGVEIECYINVEGKTIKGFITDLENKIVKFDNWDLQVYSLIKNKKVILTEEYDFPKIRDLFYLNDEEFLKSYSYINDLDFDKARAFEFLKGLVLK